ncbi:MAG: RagB/SusD family nutrient uptake outer membrane protein [Bacteroidota bacterium]
MKKTIFTAFLILSLVSCEKLLEEQVFIEIASNNFFQNDEDALNAVEALYAKLRADGPVTANNGQRESWGFYSMGEESVFNFNEAPTDELYVTWSTYGGYWQAFEEFQWLPNSGGHFDQMFSDLYEGIAIANNILENIDNDGISDAVRNRVKGEALMARGLFYSTAFSFYGSIPLVLEVVKDPLALPFQAPADSVISAVVRDLTTAAGLLPDEVPASETGRFTSGAAFATLARFQLNQGNWAAARDAAYDLMDLHVYGLSPSYAGIFAVENENNPEIILSIPCIAQPGIGNTFIAHTAESDYVSGGWGGHLLRNEFYATFDPADQRRTFLINTYTSVLGTTKTLNNGYMIMKYEVDPNRIGAWAGNDIVLHRYAEVLLTLAEALNEIDGPNQESIDLINELRNRAFNNDPSKRLQLSDFADKASLRKAILDERGWELYAEGYRRDDLIRQGEFISRAQERGKQAFDYQVVYPIPQVELDRNPNLDQNTGYNN